MKFSTVIIILGCILCLCSCGRDSESEARLHAIDALCDSIPQAAIDTLAAIDPSSLSGKDLYRYQLLQIKSRDKAYVAHTSDSLILDVIDYYGRHRSEGLYPEALYYGGRVYSDLGDLPTALEYFQKSLDEIPEDDAHMRFRSTVLFQTGRALYNLRLDSTALEYLERSLEIESTFDRINPMTAFTHTLIASLLRRHDMHNEAHRHIDEAIRISSVLDSSDSLTVITDLAEMLYQEGRIDSALSVIRPLPSLVDSITTPFCLIVAAKIYKYAGIADTAYMYARRLTRLSTPANRNNAYMVIFSDELRGYVPKDTLLKLIPEYKSTIEEYLDTHEATQAIMQNSLYNYSSQVRRKEKAEHEARSFKMMAFSAIGLLLLSGLTVALWLLSRKYRKTRRKADLMEGIAITEMIKAEAAPTLTAQKPDLPPAEACSGEEDIKNRILERMKSLQNKPAQALVDAAILESDVYIKLKDLVNADKCIVEYDECIRQLELLIERVSPGFGKRLDIMSGWQISAKERTVALLMKCGFTNKQCTTLLARATSTISSQRSAIAKKVGIPIANIDVVMVLL